MTHTFMGWVGLLGFLAMFGLLIFGFVGLGQSSNSRFDSACQELGFEECTDYTILESYVDYNIECDNVVIPQKAIGVKSCPGDTYNKWGNCTWEKTTYVLEVFE